MTKGLRALFSCQLISNGVRYLVIESGYMPSNLICDIQINTPDLTSINTLSKTLPPSQGITSQRELEKAGALSAGSSCAMVLER